MSTLSAGKVAGLGALFSALGLFAIWTLATWLLEGRIETLLRPHAVADRAIHAIVANILIGTVIPLILLRFLLRGGALTREVAGFGNHVPSPLQLVISEVDIADFCDAWGASARPGVCGYSSDWMALSSRKRIAPSLLVSAITKRTRPCLEVSA
jgi:hypothetical protein